MVSIKRRIKIALRHTMRTVAGTLLISIAYIVTKKEFLAGVGLGTVILFGTFTLFMVFGPYIPIKKRSA